MRPHRGGAALAQLLARIRKIAEQGELRARAAAGLRAQAGVRRLGRREARASSLLPQLGRDLLLPGKACGSASPRRLVGPNAKGSASAFPLPAPGFQNSSML